LPQKSAKGTKTEPQIDTDLHGCFLILGLSLHFADCSRNLRRGFSLSGVPPQLAARVSFKWQRFPLSRLVPQLAARVFILRYGTDYLKKGVFDLKMGLMERFGL